MLILFRFDEIDKCMLAAKLQAERRHPSPCDSYVYRLVDNPEKYADSPIGIEAYPVLKHCLKSIVYLNIHPTRWTKGRIPDGKMLPRRQFDSGYRRVVFFTAKEAIEDYIRRKKAQHQIHAEKVRSCIERLEYAQLRGKIPVILLGDF